MRHQRGFVLLNALILVTAMAAAAVLVLSQAETGRANLAASQEADQLAAYLDAFEAYAQLTLAQDGANVDHPSDSWAKPPAPFALDRGEVSGEITDLEARFNLNWLANPSDALAGGAFETLLERIGARPGLRPDIEAAVSFNQSDARGYSRLDPPLSPVSGPRAMVRQLQDIPALSEKDRARIAPYTTVLPGDSRLNVNTVPAEVLAGFFPDASAAQVRKALSTRLNTPFGSVDAFLQAMEVAQGAGLGEDFDSSRFTVGSTWFMVTMQAKLGTRTAARTVVLERLGPGQRSRVHWRITRFQ